MKKQLLIGLFCLCTTLCWAQKQYGLMTLTGNVALGTQKASYLQTTKGGINNLDNSKATEIAGWNNIYSFNNYLYVTNIDGDNRIAKYKANGDGTVSLDKTIIVSAANTGLSYLTFISKDLAAGIAYNMGVYFFNPTTMQLLSGKIDLSSLSDANYNSNDVTEMVYRDGKLFVGIMYRKYNGPLSTTVKEECKIAVCDVATFKMEKVITNNKTMPTGIHAHYNGAMMIDDQGDIYCLGTKFYDANRQAKNPTAILRIKKGQTDFDTTYFFNTETATGNRGVITLEYAGIGSKAFISVYYPDKVNALDPYSGYNDPVFKYWTVDLQNKTVAEVNMPFHKGYTSSWMCPIGNGKVLASVITKAESAIYQFDYETKTSTKVFSTTSEPQGIYPIEPLSVAEVEEVMTPNLRVYPNPAQDVLRINMPVGVEQGVLTITNLFGQVVYNQTLSQAQTVDVSVLSQGLYQVSLQSKQQTFITKFVK